MRGFARWIVVTAVACLACGLHAEEQVGGSLATAPPPLPGIGTHDPRIRVEPDVGPWRAVGKLQAASIDLHLIIAVVVLWHARSPVLRGGWVSGIESNVATE